MKKLILKTTTLTLLSSSMLFASGYRIPEQSASSVALSGAYIANSNGAEASYYNPANISFNKNKSDVELDLTYIKLDSIIYTDNRATAYNGKSKSEDFLIPTLFFSSKNKNNLSYGFSITAPGGLSKRWDDRFPKTSAEEFTLKIIEANPVVAYQLNPTLSIAGGLRAIYTDGIVKSNGYVDTDGDGVPETQIARDMTGDSIDYGYNIALAFKPTNKTNLSLTYRSNVNLSIEGNAKLYYNSTEQYNGGTNVTVPLPAVLAASYAQTFNQTTIELSYDKTYWSEYKNLDFNYATAIANPVLVAAFDNPKAKNWKDSNAYRIGITHQYTDTLTLMAGFAIDQTPVPEETLGFELPDSDAKIYSFGMKYKLANAEFKLGYLLDIKDDRTIITNENKINGTFSNAKAHLLSFGYKKEF